MTVCHLTSVHPRKDPRIFLKECCSLSNAGFNTFLVVADGLGDEIDHGVKIIDAGRTSVRRFYRFLFAAKKVYEKALEIDADVYHFHDPELMFFAFLLKKKGKKIIYDAHEDLPRQIMTKPYLSRFSRPFISFVAEKFENYFASKYDAVVTVTKHIEKRFLNYTDSVYVIFNYPRLDEITSASWDEKKDEICYIGSISKVRGVTELVQSISNLDVKLNLAGKFNSRALEIEVRENKGWDQVKYFGFISRPKVQDLLNRSKIGVIILHPTTSYINALPVKLFEYMLAGIPVIVSNVLLCKEIVEKQECGISVNPFDTIEINKAIQYYINDNTLAKKHGDNGRKAVLAKYSWKIEEKKLLKLYSKLTKNEN